PHAAEIPKKSRWERLLLGLSATFLLVNFLALSLVRGDGRPLNWIHFGVWLLCAVGGSLLLDRYLPGRDPLLFAISLFLSGWGLLMIDRLAPNFADRQTVWLAVSLVAMLAVALLPGPLRWLRSYRYILLMFGLLLLAATIILGRNPSDPSGATN